MSGASHDQKDNTELSPGHDHQHSQKEQQSQLHNEQGNSEELPPNPFNLKRNMAFQNNIALQHRHQLHMQQMQQMQHGVGMQDQSQAYMHQQLDDIFQLGQQQQSEMQGIAHTTLEQIHNINNTMQQQYTKLADTTTKGFIGDQRQIVTLQKQMQYIALQVHRLHHVSKMDILNKVRELKAESSQLHKEQGDSGELSEEGNSDQVPPKGIDVKDYLSMLDKYRVASSYLMMQMEPKLFVYVSPKRRNLLKGSKEELRKSKHSVGQLDIVTDKVTSTHLSRMTRWYHAIRTVEKCENSNYAFATRRRIQMKGAETLSIELANLLDYETKSRYNDARNELQRKEDEFNKADKEKIQTLTTQLDNWRKNLHLLFLCMKYTRHMSKTKNIQKALHGKGKDITDQERKEYRTAKSEFIMSNPDKYLLPLIDEDAVMGQLWIKDPSARNEDAEYLNDKEKSKIRNALLANLPKIQSGESGDKNPQEITLTNEQWKACEIQSLNPNIRIGVNNKIYKPKSDVIGREWIEVPNASEELPSELTKAQIKKLRQGLSAQQPKKQSLEITLTADQWEECEIRILSSETKIKVGGDIFKPKGAKMISQVENRRDDGFQEATKKLLDFYRKLKFSTFLSDTAHAFKPADEGGHGNL